MRIIVYRKSDKAVVGMVHPQDTPEQMEIAIRAKLFDLTEGRRDGKGGVKEDYAYLESESGYGNGMEARIVNDTVEWQETAIAIARRDALESAQLELQGFGLSPDTIKIILNQ